MPQSQFLVISGAGGGGAPYVPDTCCWCDCADVDMGDELAIPCIIGVTGDFDTDCISGDCYLAKVATYPVYQECVDAHPECAPYGDPGGQGFYYGPVDDDCVKAP